MGIAKNYETAFYWYNKAALQRNPKAQFTIGQFYENGYGRPINNKQAIIWYQKAAENQYDNAQARLAHFYYTGQVVQQNYEKAIY